MNATKVRFGEADLKKLFAGSSKIVVAKGKKVLTLDPKKDPASEIASVALGPTGNLRAPAMKLGKTWVIGFHPEVYAERFEG